MKKKLKAKLEFAKFLQDTMEDYAETIAPENDPLNFKKLMEKVKFQN
jgi:hypothetical protein